MQNISIEFPIAFTDVYDVSLRFSFPLWFHSKITHKIYQFLHGKCFRKSFQFEHDSL